MNFKKLCGTLVCAFVLVLSQEASAKVWRVNSATTAAAHFLQLDAAIANAAVLTGDTIYVEGAASNYNGANLTKRLVIIGTGYFLSENTGLQAKTNDSWLSSITLDSLGSGSVLLGLRVNQFFVSSNTDNILISRCNGALSTNSFFANSKMSNWIINKSFISNFSFNNSGYIWENLQFTNCMVSGSFFMASAVNGLIRNNLFMGGLTTSNCYVANNILINFGVPVFTNCTVKYNIAQQNVLPAGNNNQNSITQASLFVLTGSTDGKFQLAAGSPAIDAGEPVSGETPHAGPFGTADPYRLSGIPPIPAIYAFSAPASVPSSATVLTVTISARSNN